MCAAVCSGVSGAPGENCWIKKLLTLQEIPKRREELPASDPPALKHGQITNNTRTRQQKHTHKHKHSTLTSDWPRACQRGLSEPIRGQCPLCPEDANKVPFSERQSPGRQSQHNGLVKAWRSAGWVCLRASRQHSPFHNKRQLTCSLEGQPGGRNVSSWPIKPNVELILDQLLLFPLSSLFYV